jgi:16S rRNA (cytosine1402-N4)-methyltransferase
MTERGRPLGAGAAKVRLRHIPVLLDEVLEGLGPVVDRIIIDGTFGAGGYTSAILEGGASRVLAIDRDPTAIAAGAELAARFRERLVLRQGCFGDLEEIARRAGIAPVSGIVLDVGVSSMQLDEAERGFSFQADGPLDMRMSREGLDAAAVVNSAGEDELADILFRLGEERQSRRIARAIVKAREQRRIETTGELANLVARAVRASKGDPRHPATRTFQALRIHVNDELGELDRALTGAERLLEAGGRFAIVSFHSLEDRIVKQFLAERSGRSGRGSRHQPDARTAASAPSFRIINQRPVTPSEVEIAANVRARSARLRVAERTAAPPWAGANHQRAGTMGGGGVPRRRR